MNTKRESRGFLRELEHLINSHSMENISDTPDFILAQYIAGCLQAWQVATRARDEWFNFVPFGTCSPPDGVDGRPLGRARKKKACLRENTRIPYTPKTIMIATPKALSDEKIQDIIKRATTTGIDLFEGHILGLHFSSPSNGYNKDHPPESIFGKQIIYLDP